MDDPPKAEESAPGPPPVLDDDSPGEVRVTFIVLMLAAAALCAVPRQWASVGILLGLALVGVVLHLRAKARA
jgi:hypothetical protein